tara:strand:+ start:2298 stop:4052 length:1755 start_codon:yes stop_codon:yes gene_type:complete
MKLRHFRINESIPILLLVLVALTTLNQKQVFAQATGVISGSVTVNQGEVQAFRVKARDTVGHVAYTVYTLDGRYQIFNLPPGPYEVQVVEAGFEPLVKMAQVTEGATATVDLALTSTGPVAAEGAGAGAAEARANYGGSQINADGALLVDFDELYPPDPARDLMLQNCFGCHGPAAFHNRGVKNEAGWRRAVNRMFDVDGQVANMAVGVPQLTYDTVSMEEKELIIKYLADNFGPGSTQRDLLLDPVVRDEAALSKAIYIQYEFNRGPRKEVNGPPPSWSVHSAFASIANPGVIWVSGNGSNSIIRVDTDDRNYETRTTEYWIENDENINVTPHGILEFDGIVYWVELSGDHLGELNPETGEQKRYRMPVTGGGPHSAWADSRGNIWYTYFASAGVIGRFDTNTKEFTEWEPLKGFSGYGILVDRLDRVWAVGLHTPATLMYNQETGEWKSYPMSNPARRPAIDSNGKIWAAHFYGNAITKIDPVTNEITEYELPLKDGNPYEIWPDEDNNLWIENMIYNSLVKFDQQTTEFVYYPFPEIRAHTPKIDRGPRGALWFTLGNFTGPGLAAFKPNGNVAVDDAGAN